MENMKINKTKLRKTWGDLNSLPFLEILQEKLPSIGFYNELKVDYDSGFLVSSREVSNIELVLTITPCRSSKGEIECSVQFGFDSKILKEILDSIKPWECNSQLFTSQIDRSLPTERVANLNFYLLINSFNGLTCPSTFTFTLSNYKYEIEKLIKLISFSVDNCVFELSDTRVLSNELVKLARSGLNRSNYGLSSSNAMAHAALLNIANGNKERALELLDEGLKLELVVNDLTWGFDKTELEISNQISQCQYDKYTWYVKNT